MNKAIRHISVIFISVIVSSSALASAPAPSAGMGKGVYGEDTVSNSCAFCHGATGGGGKVKEAAKLTEPKSWKIYKILGGDQAFAKDKADFLKKMAAATEALILTGGVVHSSRFKIANPWFDVAKGGGPYNSQMLGMSAVPAKKWLQKYADKGVTAEIGAASVYLYVQTLDKQGVFK